MPEIADNAAVAMPDIHEHPSDALTTEQWLAERSKPAQAEEPVSKTAEESGASKPEQVLRDDESGEFKVSPGVQKRIDKAVKAQREAERRAEEAERKLQDKQVTQPAKETVAQPDPTELKPPVKPKIEDFNGADAWEKYEAAKDKYFEDLTDFKAKSAVADDRKQRAQETEKAKQAEADKTRIDKWNESDVAAKAAHDDYEEIFASFAEDVKAGKRPAFSNELLGALIESEAKAELAYHLIKTPEDLELVQNAPPYKLGYVLGKIEAKLDLKAEAKPVPEPKKEAKPLPKPPDAVKGNATAGSGPSEEDSPEEWARKRTQQVRAKGNRF